MVTIPNFVPQMKLMTSTNSFNLAGPCPDQKIETRDGRARREANQVKEAFNRVCDSGNHRPGEVDRVHHRLDQLEAMLPMQEQLVRLPYENDLGGTEIFQSSYVGLAPRLMGWYGEPPKQGEPSTIFLYGTGFHVHETRIVVGGIGVDPATNPDNANNVVLLSRNVMRITIPNNARVVRTHDGRVAFDVHVATPNGISNHLTVEAEPTARPAAKASACSCTFSLKTPEITAGYCWTVSKVDHLRDELHRDFPERPEGEA